MRLEQLFLQLNHFLSSNAVWDRRAAIETLLDIMAIFSRHDLKSEILKELDRHSSVLNQIASNQSVDTHKLDQILNELTDISKSLYQSSGRIGTSVMANELFKSISQRSTIPGGTCSFDLPSYHFWLGQDEASQLKDIQEWIQPFTTIHTAIDLMLKFIRQSRLPSQEIAHAGFFQLSLDKNLSYQLIRIKIAKEIPCFVEISGGKHRFSARFMLPSSSGGRASQSTDNIPFEITCCLF
jgi:cell division protein ZapD